MDSEVPVEFRCPITHECMVDPVLTDEGHSFERKALQKWMTKHRTSPMTNNKIKSVTTNFSLKDSIERWRTQRSCEIRECDIEPNNSLTATGAFKKVTAAVLKSTKPSAYTIDVALPLDVCIVEQLDKTTLANEISALVQLKHSRLVRYFGLYTPQNGNVRLITEISLPGLTSLSSVVQREKLAEKKSFSSAHEWAVIQQICSGMETLAGVGIIHRDLALRNILLFSYNPQNAAATSVKVCGFGLNVSRGLLDTSKSRVRWMAPEVLEHTQFSEQSDMWAFGVTVIELLARGAKPYSEIANDEQVIQYVTKLGGIPIFPNHPSLPCANASYEPLWNCMQDCWHRAPEERSKFSQFSVVFGQLAIPTLQPMQSDSSDTEKAQLHVAKSTGEFGSKSLLLGKGYTGGDCEYVSVVAARSRSELFAKGAQADKFRKRITKAKDAVHRACSALDLSRRKVHDGISDTVEKLQHMVEQLGEAVEQYREQACKQLTRNALAQEAALRTQLRELDAAYAIHDGTFERVERVLNQTDEEVVRQSTAMQTRASSAQPSSNPVVSGELNVPSGEEVLQQLRTNIASCCDRLKLDNTSTRREQRGGTTSSRFADADAGSTASGSASDKKKSAEKTRVDARKRKSDSDHKTLSSHRRQKTEMNSPAATRFLEKYTLHVTDKTWK